MNKNQHSDNKFSQLKKDIDNKSKELHQHLQQSKIEQEQKDKQYELKQNLKEFVSEYQSAILEAKNIEKQIQRLVNQQIDLTQKPKQLPQLYREDIQPLNMLRKKLWYRLYKYWHEPFIEKNYEDDKLLLLKQQNAYKKRLKRRQKGKHKSAESSQQQQKDDSDSVDFKNIIDQQKKNQQKNDKSNVSEEFDKGEDDPDNDEIAQIVSQKVDPFNINHKKNQNLYRDTLLECIGKKPHKIVKNVSLPTYYVNSQKRKQQDIEQFYKKEFAEKRFQICEPTKKREQEYKTAIRKNLKEYLKNIKLSEQEQLEFVQTIQNDDNTHQNDEIEGKLKIPKVLTSNEYKEVYLNKKKMPLTQQMLTSRAIQNNDHQSNTFKKTLTKYMINQQQESSKPSLTERTSHNSDPFEQQHLETRFPKYGKFNSQGKLQLKKFHEQIQKNSKASQNTLAFQETRENKLSYPCLNTQTLIDKASDALKSLVAQKKISEINQANHQVGISLEAKKEKLDKIEFGQVQLPYDLKTNRKKYLSQQRNEQGNENSSKQSDETASDQGDVSFKEFKTIIDDILQSRKQEKKKTMDRIKKQSKVFLTQKQSGISTPRRSIQTYQSSRIMSPQQQQQNQSLMSSRSQYNFKFQSQKVLNNCKELIQESQKDKKDFNVKENNIKKEFETLTDRASHNIYLENDDVKQSVSKFHSNKHIFIYSKDLTKGYFLKVDPNKINEVAQQLSTFKFKEPRIVAEDDKVAEQQEKQFLQKYFHKRFKPEDLPAEQQKPKYREKFINKVLASTEMCSLKLDQLK